MPQEEKKSRLFSEFPPISTEEWEALIRADLKGADYEKKLVWKTGEGFDVKPYYRKEDLSELEFLMEVPGEFPFVRGDKTTANDWYIRQDIRVNDIEKANAKALDILMKGIDSLGFILEDKAYTEGDLDRLMKNIFAEIVEVNFACPPGLALQVMQHHYDLIVRYNRDFQKIHGSIDFDPLGYLMLKGAFFKSKEESFDTARRLIDIARHFPHFSVLQVNGSLFRNAGSSIVQELAFSLACGTEYLTQLTDTGVSVDLVAPNIKYTFGTGSNYFLEIARIRAARLLWASIVKAYGPSDNNIALMKVHAVTLDWNKTLYDPYVNMLRTTTEAMSAIIAGVDSLTVKPFDSIFEEPGDFSERIARNQQLLLKEESYFDKIVDPAAGSYYIENLTASIAEESWKLFLEIESRGGFIEAFRQGYIQELIAETAREKDKDIATRRQVILGTNQYPNFGEHISKEVNLTVFEEDDEKVAGAIAETLKLYRGAQEFERLRYETDQYALKNGRPKAFMFTFGNLSMRIARAQFSSNFFACAGYEIIDNLGFATVDEGVEAALKQEAEIVVICSSDEEYPVIAPEIYTKLNDRAIVVIAGYPKESLEILQSSGIRHFIHIRSNVLETLREFNKELGII